MDLAQTPEQLGALATMIWAWALAFLPRLVTAVLILVVGFIVAGWASRGVKALLSRTEKIDASVRSIVGTIVRYAVIVLILVAALGQLGVQTASLLAVLGAAGLAIGLALQGTLSNVSAGLMLLWLKPFRTGDFIEVGSVAGTVKDVGLFVSQLDTFDGIYMFVPNSELWNRSLKNHSRNGRRLMSIAIGVSYEADVADARRVLLDLAAEDPGALKDPAPVVFVDSYGDSSVNLVYRVWAPNADYWTVQRRLIEEAKRRLEAAGIDIPFPQRVVHVLPAPGTDLDDRQREAAARAGAGIPG